jgi:zinc transport system substrate-binding protein
MAALSKARVYFAIGVPFERTWLKKIAAANPNMKVAHTDRGIKKLPMAVHGHHRHGEQSHDEKEEDDGGAEPHARGIYDPHIWLSPPLVILQARSILRDLQEVDPTHRDVYAGNYRAFISEVLDLDLVLNRVFAGQHGLQFMVFHPAWGYFAYAYGLKQVPIEIEGKKPKPGQLKELIAFAREKGIRVVFVQPQFSSKSAKLVAREIGGEVAFANPLAEDWMANLLRVADKFKTALK